MNPNGPEESTPLTRPDEQRSAGRWPGVPIWRFFVLLTVASLVGVVVNLALPGVTEVVVKGDSLDTHPIEVLFPNLQWVGWAIAVVASLAYAVAARAHSPRRDPVRGRAKPALGLIPGAAVYVVTVIVYVSSAHTVAYPGLQARFSELMRQPDSDQAVMRYGRLSERLRVTLSRAMVNGPAWARREDLSRSDCVPPIEDDGQTVRLPSYVAAGRLTEADYDRAVRTIVTTAEQDGFRLDPNDSTAPHAVHHRIRNLGGGDIYFFAVNGRIGFEVSTGCNLTAEAKRRGHPKQ